MRLDEIMSISVRDIEPESGAEEAFALMENHGLHHLVVIENEAVVGVISSEDLGGVRGAGLRRGKTVSQLMSRKPVTARPETTVKRAANLMRGRSIGCLPIIGDDGLVGIVTTSDLIELLGQGIERTAGDDKKRKTRRPGGLRGLEREARREQGSRRVRAKPRRS